MSTPRSLLYFLLIVTVLLSVAFPFIRDRYVDNVFWSDAEGYYLYLPAVVIHGGFDKVPVRTPYQFEHYPGTGQTFHQIYLWRIGHAGPVFFGCARL
jgi:hypothetical protein